MQTSADASQVPAWVHGRNFPPEVAISAVRNPATAPETRLSLCGSLITMGVVRWTYERLAELGSDPALRGRADQLMALCRKLWDYDLEGQSIAVGPRSGRSTPNYWLVPAGSGKTLVVFSAMDTKLWVSIYLMQRMLAPFGVNVIYLFDPRAAYYIGGIGGAWNGHEQTTALLRRTIESMGTDSVYCFGHSSGGYGALRYGLDLEARAILTLSPVIRQLTQPQRLAGINERLSSEFSAGDIDLRTIYRNHCDAGRPVPKTILICGGENKADMRSAAEIADLPGVEHRVFQGARTHNIMGSLIASDLLRQLLSEFLSY